jgi:hypothetical protein
MLQNYNKFLTKRTVFPIILEASPDQDLHKKIRIFYASRFFSGQNKKKVRKLREQIRYLLIAIELTPGGSSTLHIYTQTIQRTT